MLYYKTLGAALENAFQEIGQTDDNGNLITATEKPMTREQYVEFLTQKAISKAKQMRIKKASRNREMLSFMKKKD